MKLSKMTKTFQSSRTNRFQSSIRVHLSTYVNIHEYNCVLDYYSYCITFSLWYDVPMEALDCGDEIGNWICNALSEPVGSLKLLYFIENPKHERGVHHDERYTKLGGKRTDKV